MKGKDEKGKKKSEIVWLPTQSLCVFEEIREKEDRDRGGKLARKVTAGAPPQMDKHSGEEINETETREELKNT